MTAPPLRVLVADGDKALARRVRRAVVASGRPVPEVLACVQPELLEQASVQDGPFDVLVAGPAMASAEGVARLAALHRDKPTLYTLLAFPENGLAPADLVRTGASELLTSTSEPTLVAGLERALDVAALWRQNPAPGAEPARPSTGHGRVFTVCSATGGCGKTFFATNLAWYLARQGAGRVVLVDLDLQFGEVAPTLHLQPTETLADLLESEMLDPANDEPVATGELEQYLTKVDEAIWVLAAPKDPVDADRVKPAQIGALLELLASRFDYVVVDTPTGLTEGVLAALDVSERLFVMASLDVTSVRNLRVLMQTMERLSIPDEAMSLVLNKAQNGVGINVKDVLRVFEDRFESVIPFSRDVPRSMNEGAPLLKNARGSEVGRILAAEFLPYLPAERRATAEADSARAPRGLVQRLTSWGGRTT